MASAERFTAALEWGAGGGDRYFPMFASGPGGWLYPTDRNGSCECRRDLRCARKPRKMPVVSAASR
jgi:hypothetical protein